MERRLMPVSCELLLELRTAELRLFEILDDNAACISLQTADDGNYGKILVC
jgi:hypothetical protein